MLIGVSGVIFGLSYVGLPVAMRQTTAFCAPAHALSYQLFGSAVGTKRPT